MLAATCYASRYVNITKLDLEVTFCFEMFRAHYAVNHPHVLSLATPLVCCIQVVIEAVVSIKTSLNPDQWDSGIEKFRRTAHVMSKPLVVWTRAPIEPPKVLVQSYDQSSAVLYWEKPLLMSIIGKVRAVYFKYSVSDTIQYSAAVSDATQYLTVLLVVLVVSFVVVVLGGGVFLLWSFIKRNTGIKK